MPEGRLMKELSTILDIDTLAIIEAGVKMDYLKVVMRNLETVLGREASRSVMRRVAMKIIKDDPQTSRRIRRLLGEM
ncbi:MAG: hypothetical protein QXD32_00615 [Nitrososphaerota archaeon]